MYDVGDKLVNGIKSVYVNSLACVRVKEGQSDCFRIKCGVTGVYHVPLNLPCIYGSSDEGGKNDGNGMEGRQ